MKKFASIIAVAALSLTVAACESSSEFTGLSSISKECRTAYNCDQEVVVAKKKTEKKATRVFNYSNRK